MADLDAFSGEGDLEAGDAFLAFPFGTDALGSEASLGSLLGLLPGDALPFWEPPAGLVERVGAAALAALRPP